MTTVHLDPTILVGRVYYGDGGFEDRTPFDAVFTAVLLGDGKAKLIAAHGTITRKAYGVIARALRDQYGVTQCDMERRGKPITVSTDRASDFGGV